MTSSRVRKQPRQMSSPRAVVQWPVQGQAGEISSRRREGFKRMPDYNDGSVASSNRASQANACARDSPHISTEGCSPPQNEGRSVRPNTLQRSSSSSCTHGMPAGLPCGMPGSGEVMDGEMQHAPQAFRHCKVMPCDRPRHPVSQTRLISLPCLFPRLQARKDLLWRRSRAHPG